MIRKLAGAAVAGSGLVLALGSVSALGATTYEQCMQKAGQTAQTSGVQVCKTVIVTKLHTWSWSLQKSAGPSTLQLATGGSAPLGYTITATPTEGISWYVSGAVIVKNFTGADVNDVDATDTFSAPGSPPQTTVVATGQRVKGDPTDNERHFDYGFVTPNAVAGATNTGAATWTGGSGSVTVPVDFANPPNEVAYNRKVTLADTFASLDGTGLGIGAPSDPGPWTLEADNPATLSKSLTVDVTNQSLAPGATAAVGNTATVRSITREPEVLRLDDASVKNIPLGLEVNAAAQASVPVTAPTPTTPATPTTPGATTSTPLGPVVGAATTKPRKTTKGSSVCPRPLLGMSLLGPKSLTAGQRVTYTLRITNRAKNPAKNTVLTYPIPSGMSLVSTTGAQKAVKSSSIRLGVGTIPAKGSKTVKLILRVDSTAAGSKLSRATASSSSCGATAAATLPISVKAIGAAVTPAVTG
jgi:uncharacterized repeat protein (TIGR01451 family)